MANRLMSAYGNVAKARTDIGRNLSDIAGIGIEMEYGSEGRIAGEMAQRDIVNKTAAIGLGLETIQQVAGLGVGYEKETEAAESVGGREVYKKRVKDSETGEYSTQWGDKGNLFQKLGRFLGFSERQFDIGGDRFTGAQVEAAVPYTKIGKTWAEAAGLVGGGSDIQYYGYDDRETPSTKPIISNDELLDREGYSVEEPVSKTVKGKIKPRFVGDTQVWPLVDNESNTSTTTTSPYDITKETGLGDLIRWREEGSADYSDLINKAMIGRDWGEASSEWENIRKGYL